jgi:hypothetical protein
VVLTCLIWVLLLQTFIHFVDEPQKISLQTPTLILTTFTRVMNVWGNLFHGSLGLCFRKLLDPAAMLYKLIHFRFVQ